MTLASLTFRTRYGTAAVYIKSDLNHTEIWYDVEITVNTVLSHPVPNTHMVGIYRSKTGRILQLIEALTHLHKSVLTEPAIAITLFGDLNKYTQLIN